MRGIARGASDKHNIWPHLAYIGAGWLRAAVASELAEGRVEVLRSDFPPKQERQFPAVPRYVLRDSREIAVEARKVVVPRAKVKQHNVGCDRAKRLKGGEYLVNRSFAVVAAYVKPPCQPDESDGDVI